MRVRQRRAVVRELAAAAALRKSEAHELLKQVNTILERLDSAKQAQARLQSANQENGLHADVSSQLVDCTSRPVSGAKRISCSCGYCESHQMSAPRSIMPCWISKTMPLPPEAAYCIATSRFFVIDL